MAVTNVSTFNSNAVGYVVASVPGRVSAVVLHGPLGVGNHCIMLYDQTSAPTIGTDTPVAAVESGTPTTQGLKGTFKFIFPGGGRRFGTGIALGVATTFNGATGVGGAPPASIDVYWEPGN